MTTRRNTCLVSRVKIERYMGGALGGVSEQLDLVSSGAVDIINLHLDQYPQQLPLHKILNSEQFVSDEQALMNIIAITREIPQTMTIGFVSALIFVVYRSGLIRVFAKVS